MIVGGRPETPAVWPDINALFSENPRLPRGVTLTLLVDTLAIER